MTNKEQAILDEIKLKLTGDILELELDDTTLYGYLKSSLRELQRYITSTRMVTTAYQPCIKLSEVIIGYEDEEETVPIYMGEINHVVAVYRTTGGITSDSTSGSIGMTDPMNIAQWQLLSGMGNITYFQDAVYNYEAYLTMQQLRNTLSTDLAFRYDRDTNQLYVNVSQGTPDRITIEWIPLYETVDAIKSPYWEDQLIRLTIANVKIALGRIRSKYTLSNALYQLDGQTILAEGIAERDSLREALLANSELTYPID